MNDNMSGPTSPFEVKYTTARPGEKQLPPRWAIPFDDTFRELELPNAEAGAYGGYASIGWHMVQNPVRYCPAYKVREVLNLKLPITPKQMSDWEKKTTGELLVTNRYGGTISWITPSMSIREAVVSWFVRERGHEGLVLCYNRMERAWYVEAMRDDLKVWVNAEGSEVSAGEGDFGDYLVENHPHAVMVWGE